MALMSELRQWCSIRTVAKELNFREHILFRVEKAYDNANKLLKQIELDSIDNKLQRFLRKQRSRTTRKREKYVKLVDDFEARRVAANVDVNRAFQKAQRQSRKLEQARRRRGRREALLEARIRCFNPTSYVIVMDIADITSISVMRDQGKELHFTIGRSVTEGNRVSIEKAARRVGLHCLDSQKLVYLDGANYQILSVEESNALGYRRLV